jgi:hypothetical protein
VTSADHDNVELFGVMRHEKSAAELLCFHSNKLRLPDVGGYSERDTMKRISITSFVLLLAAFLTAAYAADRGPSTPEERARAVKAAQLLQKTPFSPAARTEGKWGLQWITDVPDINVTICGEFSPEPYKYQGVLLASHVMSMAAFIIKNPNKAGENDAVWRAGVAGMLLTYETILKQKRDGDSDFYDDLLKQRAEDNLDNFMHEFEVRCVSDGPSNQA